MNELIKELARRAAEEEGWPATVWQTTFTEKFAELIIREGIINLTRNGHDEAASQLYWFLQKKIRG